MGVEFIAGAVLGAPGGVADGLPGGYGAVLDAFPEATGDVHPSVSHAPWQALQVVHGGGPLLLEQALQVPVVEHGGHRLDGVAGGVLKPLPQFGAAGPDGIPVLEDQAGQCPVREAGDDQVAGGGGYALEPLPEVAGGGLDAFPECGELGPEGVPVLPDQKGAGGDQADNGEDGVGHGGGTEHAQGTDQGGNGAGRDGAQHAGEGAAFQSQHLQTITGQHHGAEQ